MNSILNTIECITRILMLLATIYAIRVYFETLALMAQCKKELQQLDPEQRPKLTRFERILNAILFLPNI